MGAGKSCILENLNLPHVMSRLYCVPRAKLESAHLVFINNSGKNNDNELGALGVTLVVNIMIYPPCRHPLHCSLNASKSALLVFAVQTNSYFPNLTMTTRTVQLSTTRNLKMQVPSICVVTRGEILQLKTALFSHIM